MTAYVCPLCEVVAREPCEDVFMCAAAGVAKRDSHVVTRFVTGEPVESLTLAAAFVAAASWPALLSQARAHDGTACDPVECEECLRGLSVLQVEQFFWATREAALTGS